MTRPVNRVLLRAIPQAGFLVPGFLVRVVFAGVAAALCIARVPAGFWLVVAFAGIGLAVIVPRSLAAWAVLVGLGVDQLLGPPATAGAAFAVLVAAVHLLHVLAAQMLVVPGRALVQASAFGRPLLRFTLIQVPVQGAVLLSVTVFASGNDTSIPVLGVLGAVAVIVLAVVLAAPLLRERAPE